MSKVERGWTVGMWLTAAIAIVVLASVVRTAIGCQPSERLVEVFDIPPWACVKVER